MVEAIKHGSWANNIKADLHWVSSMDVEKHGAKKVLENFGGGSGHVFNLGHGISQFTPPDNVALLVDTVHQYRHDGGKTKHKTL